MYCDLHTHSTASDGTATPTELADLAADAGLGAMALTDHDTTEGLAECGARCAQRGIRFVPGIEISSDPNLGRDAAATPDERPPLGTLHILGFFVRHDDPELARIHQRMCDARNQRNPAIVDRLRQLGIDITYEQVQALAAAQGTRVIGRPHIGEVLVAQGHVASMPEAFDRYLGRHGAAYVRRDRLPARTAVNAIHHAGGLAILAHPVQLGLQDHARLQAFIQRLASLGLDGLETHHTDHDASMARSCEAMARALELLTSGGSDYHGARKSVQLNGQRVPMAIYDRLYAAWQNRGGGTSGEV